MVERFSRDHKFVTLESKEKEFIENDPWTLLKHPLVICLLLIIFSLAGIIALILTEALKKEETPQKITTLVPQAKPKVVEQKPVIQYTQPQNTIPTPVPPAPSTEVRYHFCPPQYISPDPGTKWCTDNSGERCNFPPSESRRLCAIFTGSSIDNVKELPPE